MSYETNEIQESSVVLEKKIDEQLSNPHFINKNFQI